MRPSRAGTVGRQNSHAVHAKHGADRLAAARTLVGDGRDLVQAGAAAAWC